MNHITKATMSVMLKCADGDVEETNVRMLRLSTRIDAMLGEANPTSRVDVPIPDVEVLIMRKILEFLRYHNETGIPIPVVSKPVDRAAIHRWDADFMDALEPMVLLKFAHGAFRLDIEPLIDISCCKLASILQTRSPKEIHAYFYGRDLTPEEEDQIRRDNAWILDVTFPKPPEV